MSIQSKFRSIRFLALLLCATLAAGLFAAGCGGGGGGGGLSNDDPGDNDLNVVMAFGDSLTAGEVQPAYPAILSGLIGKTVSNDGTYGATAAAAAGRAGRVIDKRKGAFMLILYGVNDIMFGRSTSAIAGSLEKVVTTCKSKHVVPVLATYPIPINGHQIFAGATHRLNDAIRELAARHGIFCVDLEKEFMDGGDPDPTLYLDDGLHPNAEGNQVMALAFADLF
jgi:lysophospholipase L1-like esterase